MKKYNGKTVKWITVLSFILIMSLVLFPTVFNAQAQELTQTQSTAQAQELTQTQVPAPTQKLTKPQALKAFREKEQLLKAQVFASLPVAGLQKSPAGEAGHVVFFSVCDKTSRADVYCGIGADLESAWQDAAEKTKEGIRSGGQFPVWVKADVVYSARRVSIEELRNEVTASRQNCFRYGVSLDDGFQHAFLEAELNGARIYDYERGDFSYKYLCRYLEKAGREEVSRFPDTCILFMCYGWFCDEDGTVSPLISEGLDAGRRAADVIDKAYAESLISSGADYLSDQVQEDGSFLYGLFPRFDTTIEGYNIVRHAGTLWSLVCRYRMNRDPDLKDRIGQLIHYMISQIIYDDSGAAYLIDADSGEIKLGSLGTAVIALSEYIDAAGESEYVPLCTALGRGILNMMDPENGTYWHVLNEDFSKKEEYRTVYYDGEAAFALVRLYGLTGDVHWLDAACAAADHFIEADYARYRDHWIAYTMNELTKYVEDRQDYYSFGLYNAWSNLQVIAGLDTTSPRFLELLMSAFELYDRAVQNGMSTDGYKIADLLEVIRIRTSRQLNGFFFPEYAMYMANPQRIMNSFMVRNKSFRVRIDDVQHNIGGYYLYWKNYDKLLSYGMHF